MKHYLVPTIPLEVEIMGINPCRGVNALPNKFMPDEFRMTYATSGMDYRAKFESTLQKIEFTVDALTSGQRKIFGVLEVKNIDSSREIDSHEMPTIQKGDNFIVEGFLNCDIYTYIHGPTVKPEKLTFLTRCILHIKAP